MRNLAFLILRNSYRLPNPLVRWARGFLSQGRLFPSRRYLFD